MLTGTVAVTGPAGVDAVTDMLNTLDGPAVKELDAAPVASVTTDDRSVPLANAAPPPPICGIANTIAMAGIGTSFSSVTFTTTCELTRPPLTRLTVLASSRIVSLYFWGMGFGRSWARSTGERPSKQA